MFGSQVLEVMVGLLLIYLALSVACSGIKEVIASVFSLRAKTLEAAIRNMLHDDTGDLTQRIFEHPVIAGTAPLGQKPSYISSRNFAVALFEVLAVSDAGTGQVANASQATPGPRTLQDLRASIANLSHGKLRMTLLGFVDASQGNLDAAQKKIETWFDDTMQRVSGWYKRSAQKLIFCAGFALCLALNADTLVMTKELWSDQALRSTVVAHATHRVEHPQTLSTSADVPADSLTFTQLQTVAAEVRAAQSLPLGWGREPQGFKSTLQHWPAGLLKLLGILVSSFAILMGAPFWFDLLNNVMNLRLTGRPPD